MEYLRENIIIVDGVTKINKGVRLLDNINVVFKRGKIYGIVGKNGSGKTMLIKAICGMVKQYRGSITVDGKIVGKNAGFTENIGAMIETPSFISSESAYKNLAYTASLHRKIGSEEILYAIMSVGLDPIDVRPVEKYSFGMIQRLGIAQAIMENPDIIILDGAFNGLDRDGVERIGKLIMELKCLGKTIILLSHCAKDIGIFCDEMYEMDKGKLIRCCN